MKILFVVHRLYPAPGGSEINVFNMMRAMQKRGHEVWGLNNPWDMDAVHLINQRNVDYNGLDKNFHYITFNDFQKNFNQFDLIIVHGSGVNLQDLIISLKKDGKIKTPVLYLIIMPNLASGIPALESCEFVGWATSEDKRWATDVMKTVCKFSDSEIEKKLVQTYYHVNATFNSVDATFNLEPSISSTKYLITSAGGFWPHKGHREIVDTFMQLPENVSKDITLVLMGYYGDLKIPNLPSNIKIFPNASRDFVLDMIFYSDLYLQNSYEEGYGLTLVEAMLMETPWAARPVGVVPDIRELGIVYNNLSEVLNENIVGNIFEKQEDFDDNRRVNSFKWALENCNSKIMGDALEGVLAKC